METNDDAEARDAAVVAAAVEAGTDGIVVPPELIEESPTEVETPVIASAPEASSLYAQILVMPMGERVKLAMRGNKEARVLLLRLGTRTIRRYVLQNPRITDEEVVHVARDRQADEEMLRVIMHRREWMKVYQVRLALVRNPRTPLATSMRLLATLLARDVERIAKSRDVPQGVVAHARRMLLESRHRG